MDEVFARFLHLGEQIYEELDDGSLLRSRVVARSWLDFVDYKDYPWTRIQNMVADLRKNCIDDAQCTGSYDSFDTVNQEGRGFESRQRNFHFIFSTFFDILSDSA